MIPRGTPTVTIGVAVATGRAVGVAVGGRAVGVAVGGIAVGVAVGGIAVGVAVAGGGKVVAEAVADGADWLPAASKATMV
jgi:hypothetical protein